MFMGAVTYSVHSSVRGIQAHVVMYGCEIKNQITIDA